MSVKHILTAKPEICELHKLITCLYAAFILATNWLERLNLAYSSLTNLCLIIERIVKGLLCFIKPVQYNISCVWFMAFVMSPSRGSYCWR